MTKKNVLCTAAIIVSAVLCSNMCVVGSHVLNSANMSAAAASAEAVGNLIVNVTGLPDLSGISITVTGNGKVYQEVTNASGQAVFSKLPVQDSAGNVISYTIKESIPEGYMAATSMTTALSAGSTVIATIPNTEKTYTIAIDCKDYRTGSTAPSGDAVLSGGAYTIYHDGAAYGTYSIAADGTLCEFTLHGDAYKGTWEIQMDSAPVGYYLDSTMQELGYYDGNTWVALNSSFPQYTHATMHLSLVPITGRFSVQANDGDEIQIYLKSSGSYQECRADERAVLTAEGSDSSIQTQALPFGTYIIQNLTTGETTTKKITSYGEIVPVAFTSSAVQTTTSHTISFETNGAAGTMIFDVLDAQGNRVYRFSSDGSEDVTISDLQSGETYTIKEIMAPDGYEMEKECYTFVAGEDRTTLIQYRPITLATTTAANTNVTTTTSTTATQSVESKSCTYYLYDKNKTALLSTGEYDMTLGKIRLPEGWEKDTCYLLMLEGYESNADGSKISFMRQEYVVLQEDGTWESYVSTLYGDVNLDGRVDITDAVMLNKAVAGVVRLTNQAVQNGDCNANSELGVDDAMTLLKFLVKIETTLPVIADL